jgi:putative phosphoesterase
MKIAILSDIHGNHYALQEVLFEAKKNNIDHLIILGDIVGYYYHPDKVLELIEPWSFDLIRGNHEDILLKITDNDLSLDKISAKYGKGHKLAANKLTASHIQMIRNLPEKKELVIDEISILMSHGSPWLNNLYVYPDTNEEILNKFNEYKNDVILFGHTHYSCFFKTNNGFAINPGSVGQSRERGGTAYWAIFNTSNKMVQFKATKYDTNQLKKEVLSIDPDIPYNLIILDR